ncbi:hypothetical protein [Wolbachia endosymbiont of Pentidionis agamae]|uniref:hypothetical protein n=1 Tax=Wolbachia endosymbiont of Pentidionis agamae TaxID=3110435 RepID=UPI002FD6A676
MNDKDSVQSREYSDELIKSHKDNKSAASQSQYLQEYPASRLSELTTTQMYEKNSKRKK